MTSRSTAGRTEPASSLKSNGAWHRTGNQSREDYHLIVNQVRQFLKVGTGELLDSLRQNMESAAEREEFEEAARLRDRLFSVGTDAGETTDYPGQHPTRTWSDCRAKARQRTFSCCSCAAAY